VAAVKHRWIVYALALAATVAAATLAGGGQNDEPAVAPARPLPPEARASQAAMTLTSAIDTDELPRRALAGSGEGSFSVRSWEPPPPPSAAVRELPPPQAPPVAFTYGGKLAKEGAIIAVLMRQDREHIVQAGDTLDGIYRIEAIDDERVVLKYLPLGTRQTLSFGAPGAPVSAKAASGALVSAIPTSGAPPRDAPPTPRFVGIPAPVLAPYHPDHDE
jgi:hypothetical protein